MTHRIILTGGSGGLGRNFLDLARGRSDVQVLALLRDGSRRPAAFDRLACVRVDFDDSVNLCRTIRDFAPTALVHSAADGMSAPQVRWSRLLHFNAVLPVTLCQGLRGLGCHLVHISTGLSYRDQGRPLREDDPLDTLHPYGASKAASDLLVRSAAAEAGVPLTVLRPFSFTGLWDDRGRLFPSILRAASEGRSLELSPATQIRPHCSSRDIARGMLAAALQARPEPGEARVYNLGEPSTVPLRSVIEEVFQQLELRPNLQFGRRNFAVNEPMFLAPDISRAQRDLDWSPRQNLAHAVWQLARESFPQLSPTEPKEDRKPWPIAHPN